MPGEPDSEKREPLDVAKLKAAKPPRLFELGARDSFQRTATLATTGEGGMTCAVAFTGRRGDGMASAIRDKHGGETRRSDVRVWLRLLSCSTVIEKRLRRRFAEQFDTTLPRFDVLAALERVPDGITMGELSRALLVSNGNVTALVRQLERDGLIVSRADVEDRRSSIVALTAMGESHFARLAAAHHRWIGAMFAQVPPEQQDALYGLLATLKDSIGAETLSEHEV